METRSEELQEKASAIMALAENFQHELSDPLLKIWLRNLDPWPANIVENAVAMVLRNYKGWKFPSYSVLQSALDELCGKSQAQLRDQAIAEWGLLMRNISLRGTRNEPEHHPTTAYVIRLLGGWANVCQWKLAELDFKQRNFLDLWIQSHGKTDVLAQGALAIAQASAAVADKAIMPLLELHKVWPQQKRESPPPGLPAAQNK